MKYSVCIDALFPKMPLEVSLQKVKETGYSAFEFWTWWDKDIDLLEKKAAAMDLQTATFCTRFINPGSTGNHDAYLEGLRESIAVAKKLRCKTLIAQAGWEIPGVPYEVHRENILNVFRDAVPILADEDMTLVVEPLNTAVDHPGYHLVSSEDAFTFIRQIGDPHIKLLFDIYHQQISSGNIIQTIQENIDFIGHFHAAGVPGRVEPTTGELNYKTIFQSIAALGYNDYVGLEYMPVRDAAETLLATRELL